MKSATRPYRMGARADAVGQTRARILAAAYDLWLELPYDEMTLDAVGERAGSSRQTVLRHFGSKDELALAVIDWQRPAEEAAREAPPGDTATAVRRLVDRYEAMGDANARLLELEGRIGTVDHLLAQARESHRGWVERVFAPHLPRSRSAREDAVLALYAATDVTVWKLLRRDFGRSRSQTESTVRRLVDGLLHTCPTPREETR